MSDDRPKTRGDCMDGPRPCGFVSCRYNLILDVSSAGNLIPALRRGRAGRRDPMLLRKALVGELGEKRVERFADALLERFASGNLPTCALDVAEGRTFEQETEQGLMRLESIAEIMALTRERVRQLEKRALAKLILSVTS